MHGPSGAVFNVDATGTVNLERAGTAFQVENGGFLQNYGGTFVVKAGAVLGIRPGGRFEFARSKSTLRVEPGRTLLVRGGALRGPGRVEGQAGGTCAWKRARSWTRPPDCWGPS